MKRMLHILASASTCLLIAAGGAARGGHVVHFEDGRVLEVSNVERQGETILLSLPGGGAISVPSWRVVEWKEVPDREPAPQAVAAPRGEAWRKVAGTFAAEIERAARDHKVDPVLLTAVARTESNFDPLAVSPKGAQGLMQLMPQTAERFGVSNVFDVAENVDGGARYLSWLLDRFEGQTELALAGYNAGEGAVDRYSGVPPYPETENYIEKVLREAARMGSGSDAGTAEDRASGRRVASIASD